MIRIITTMLLTLAIGQLQTAANIKTIKQWNLLSYNLPLDFPANDLKFYNPRNIVATGFAVTDNRLFLATPRLFSGVPATLSSIPIGDIVGDSPVLQAYPNWAHHTAGEKEYNCSEIGLVSVYRVRIDTCNRLWALDSGISRSFEDSVVTCPPKILVFDLNTNQVIRRIDFPPEVIKGDTLCTNMIIDETTSKPENYCDDVYVYISDTVKPAIVVYDSQRDLTWRLSHPTMYPDPNFAKPNILGFRFTLMDGIVGLAFDSKTQVLYFQPLATDRLFSIAASALRAGPLPLHVELPVKLIGKKSSQGIGLEVSPIDGSIFFSPMSETAVSKWNPRTKIQRILAYDTEQFQFVADIRIAPRDSSSVYILSSKFHRFFLKKLEPNEVNIRLIKIDDILPPQLSELNDNHVASIYNATHNNIRSMPSQSKPSLSGQVYESESVRVINRTQRNPFFSQKLPNQQLKVPKYGYMGNKNYYNLKLGDFNGFRVTKSVSYTTAILHENK